MRSAPSSPGQFSAAKQALLEKRLQGAKARANTQSSIPKLVRDSNVPLSFAQQRLWFLDQLIPGSPVYNIWEIVRLKGGLDVAALEWSLDEIIRRHESLRTTFPSADGQPVQLILPARKFPLQIVDLQASPNVELQLHELAVGESKKPFDLTRDLMIRGTLFRLGPEEHVLAITMHHIASDAWSLGVLFNELSQLYESRAAGTAVNLPDLPIQYADYAVWQRECLQGPLLENQLGYWKKQLAGAPELLDLPTDKPRPGVQTFRGGAVSLRLPVHLASAIKQLSRSEGATPFMTLFAAFNVLLQRYTRQSDLLIGSPIAGRTQIETEGLIGFFVNTLVLRTNLSGNPSFRELLQRVRQVTLDAYAHQDLPFEKLVMELKPERSTSHSPLFQVMFVLQNAPGTGLKLPGVTTAPITIDNETAKFDLILSVTDNETEFSAGLEYNADVFLAGTAQRILEQFQRLLEAIVAQPECQIGRLAVSTELERQRVLSIWNNTGVEYPRSRSIADLFEEQVEEAPESIALRFKSKALTYRELNENANRVARRLQKLGVTKGARVAITLERSPDLIIALIAIVKAGAGYVSLDPEYPAERLKLMLDDVKPQVIVTEAKFHPVFTRCDASATLLVLDEIRDSLAESSGNISALCGPDDLAYISFTSGSTGRPKGVCIPHRGVVRLVKQPDYISIQPNDVFLQLAPIAFDASTLEIWGPLLNGSSLVIYPPGLPDLGELGSVIENERITTLWLTAGLFQQMVDEQLPRLKHLKQLLAGGDVLSAPHVAKALEALPRCRIINGYGPTENTTFTCCHTVSAESLRHRSIPIGRPIANTRVYVLDEFQNPVSIGVPGELYIAGDGLAQGYLDRERLTADRFLPNAFEPGTLFYRSGDLVRWLPQGELEFLGRLDNQVKIRGFRVELGEIEAALAVHPQVRDCSVVVVNNSSAGKQLVAYVVSKAADTTAPEQLRDFLRGKLPEYMVPAFFVWLPELPLNANGKIDRNALPRPELTRTLETQAEPRDDLEHQLVRLWEATLGVSHISINSSFFELGGHSLLAVRLVSQIEKTFGKKLSVATLFQAPTIEQLARVLRGNDSPRLPSSIVEVQPKGDKPPLFLVHGVGGGMFWGYTNLAKHLGHTQPIYALKSRGMDGAEEFETIEEMAAHYIADIRRVQPEGPYYLGGYCFGGNVAFEMAQQLKAAGQDVAMLALINCSPPNSSYSELRWTPAFALKFARNLGHWARNSLKWSPSQRREFIRWKFRSLRKRLERYTKRPDERVDVDMLVNLSPYPEDQRRLWEAHIKALIGYHPARYSGRVTLFRSPGHQFLCSFDDQYGWGDLAENVDVKIISGAHEQILEEPHVERVARELETCLHQARRSTNREPGSPNSAADASGENDTQYWKEQLSKVRAWPVSSNANGKSVSTGAEVESATIPRSLARSLRKFSQNEGVSLLMTLLAACGTLLYRYSRQEGFVIAANASSRSRNHPSELVEPHIEKLFFFTAELTNGMTFRQVVQKANASLTEAAQHGAVSPEVLCDYLVIEPNGLPLLVASEPHERPLPAGAPPIPAQVALLLAEGARQLRLRCLYKQQLFPINFIRRFLRHLQVLLEAAMRSPNTPIEKLPLLDREEKQQSLVEWNATAADFPLEGSYVSSFEDQVNRAPHAIAVRCGSQELTYQELNRRANCLGHYLRTLGVGPESLVAVYMDRSAEFAVAVLAILKAGGAYLPVDRSYPAERIAWVLADARARVTLTTRNLALKLPAQAGSVALDDPTLQEKLRKYDSANAPQAAQSPGQLAYVIYTSGSTGTPKGVEIGQRSLLNHNQAIIRAFELRSSDRVLQFTPLSFDISVEEMLPTWLAGATLVFRNEEVLGSVSNFVNFLAEQQITVANLPTAYFRALTQVPRLELPRSLRLVVIGGEAVSAEHWKQMRGWLGPSIQLINAYGLTEATVTSTLFTGDLDQSKPVPIGRPIANTTAYILDESLQPLPPGIAGELFIGGEGVGRGYRNSPELTSLRFLPSPFAKRERLYRTGDRARFREDGNIEFLGRLDDQVKLRGFRIQLAEIEAALATHPGVGQAVVRSLAYGDLEERLVAYFVPTGSTKVNTGELISFLQKTLPEYMIPSAFVQMDVLPLTPAGKVDYRSLPIPGTERPALREQFVAPQSELEQKIAAVWHEVLHIDEIGINDNIFDLGAHSLHAMQVMGRLADQLNLQIPVSNLFEAPTIAQLASAIEQGRANVQSAISAPTPRPRDQEEPPLSFAQQRIWFLEQLQPETPLYNLAQAIRLKGELKVAALEQAFTEIIRRHEVLRTTYHLRAEQPVQVIAPPAPYSIHRVDLSGLNNDVREKELRETVRTEAQKPFSLERDLMLRVSLIRLAPQEHIVLITTHHIASDGWSLEVLWKEIAALYNRFVQKQGSGLPELPIQYADFALWKRNWLQGEVLETQLDYWRKQLQGAPALLELPLDHPRPASQSYVGARHNFSISAKLTERLRALGQSEGCTLFMTLLSGFNSLLLRYSNAEDIIAGTVIANRNRPELEHLIGFFANTLVLRTDLSGSPTVRQTLQRTRRTTLDAYAHQDLPFERLVEELQPARDRSYHPLFQVMLVLQNVPVPAEALPGLEVIPSETDVGISKFDLLVNLVETGDGLAGYIEYSTDLFEPATIARMAGHFQILLEGAVEQSNVPITRLPLLSPAEKQQLLVDWNSSSLELPAITTIHGMFEEVARLHPAREALVWNDQRWTYAELNSRANQLAHYLRSQGISQERLVGICTRRTPQMVAAMLATLKAGGAYVPLDPAYPQERIRSILEDANVAALCTERELISLVGEVNGKVVVLDDEQTAISAQAKNNLQLAATTNNLAYVLFTSGSTGKPKGVAVEHRSVLALTAWTQSTFTTQELDGVLAGTSICFDLSVFEILVPLALGGKVVLAENVLQLTTLPARDEVRLINTVPSAMKEFLRSGGIPSSVQTVNLAGEPLDQSLVEKVYELGHVRRLWDLYGPTEATVYSTFALRQRGGRNNIGRPLPNEQLFVVDRNLQSVPLGVPGELLIGGAGLARGYLNQPDLTADRFVANLFDSKSSSRLYRTGDLVRYLPDGTVEYLGRIDHQVKIRGFRIELGEVESQLRKHPAVREAVVIADTDSSGAKRLVAYTVSPESPGPSSSDLREHLKRTLPEYMVPSLFVQLETLPLTPNGKVDRKALPKPELDRSAVEMDGEPQSDAELLLAQIWSEVLDVPRVGTRSNFFDLGGHSLMITRILSRLREALQIELPMKSIFEAPTIAEFAVLVENAVADQISRLTDDEVLELEEAETTSARS